MTTARPVILRAVAGSTLGNDVTAGLDRAKRAE
jgi:hypothetical protein